MENFVILEKSKRLWVPPSGKRRGYYRFDPREKQEYEGLLGALRKLLDKIRSLKKQDKFSKEQRQYINRKLKELEPKMKHFKIQKQRMEVSKILKTIREELQERELKSKDGKVVSEKHKIGLKKLGYVPNDITKLSKYEINAIFFNEIKKQDNPKFPIKKSIPITAARLITENGYPSWVGFPVGTYPIRSPQDDKELDEQVRQMMGEVLGNLKRHTEISEPKLVVKAEIPIKGFTRVRRGKQEFVKPSKRRIQELREVERKAQIGFKFERKLPPHFTEEAEKIGKTLTFDQAVDIISEYESIKAANIEDAYYKQYLREQIVAYLVHNHFGKVLKFVPNWSENLSLSIETIKQILSGIITDEYEIPVSIVQKENLISELVEKETFDEFKIKYNFREIKSLGYSSPEEVVDYLNREFVKLGNRVQIDGMGELIVTVGNIDPYEDAAAMYLDDRVEIILDKKYDRTLAHEYAHFIWDKKLNVPKMPMFEYLPIKYLKKDLDFFIRSKSKDYIKLAKVKMASFDIIKPEDSAFIELIDNLSKFYAENWETFKATRWWQAGYPTREQQFAYMLHPNEIFARAVSWYATGYHMPQFSLVENDRIYHDIVKEWGDKYLSTGVVKSFVIFEKAEVKGHYRTRSGKRFYVKPYRTEREKIRQLSFPFYKKEIPSPSPLKRTLTKGEITDSEKFFGGCNETHKVRLKDNGDAIFKSMKGERKDLRAGIPVGQYYKRESLAYEIAKMVGIDNLIPETYVRKDPKHGKGSIQKWINDAKIGYDGEFKNEDLEKAAVFDWILGNTDRHGGNFLEKDGNLFLIDNGLILSNRRYEITIFNDILEKCKRYNLLVPLDLLSKFFEKKQEIVTLLNKRKINSKAINLMLERMDLLSEVRSFENITRNYQEKYKDAWYEEEEDEES